jgi:hypothetical protein
MGIQRRGGALGFNNAKITDEELAFICGPSALIVVKPSYQ